MCGRLNHSKASCSSTTFSTFGLSYSKVYGQVRGYQMDTPDIFYDIDRNIDTYYVDGISITHGISPHKHISTYACRLREDIKHTSGCLYNSHNFGKDLSSSFVDKNFYCESGVPSSHGITHVLFLNDPLWDGKNCGGLEGPCCTNHKMPWFY